jgi:quinolinate synthase
MVSASALPAAADGVNVRARVVPVSGHGRDMVGTGPGTTGLGVSRHTVDIKLLTQVEKDSIGERQPLPEHYLRLSDDEMDARLNEAKRTLGERLVILGHHYQRDEVIKFADFTGDSLKLARAAASRGKAEFIVFCGVHFMAESADILCAPHQKVILPDLAAGCSMADMAEPEQLEMCWRELQAMGVSTERAADGSGGVIPVTYINSSAAIKAFCGEHGGIVCTSTNAASIMQWAWERGEKLVMLPDQHLGRNTAARLGSRSTGWSSGIRTS